MRLTQLTSHWDHGVSVTYQAFEHLIECEENLFVGVLKYKKPVRFYIYLN